MLTHSSCIKVVHPINSIALETKMNHLLKLWAIDKFPEADPCLIIRTWFAYPCLFSLGMQSGKEMECESTVWDRWWFAYDGHWTICILEAITSKWIISILNIMAFRQTDIMYCNKHTNHILLYFVVGELCTCVWNVSRSINAFAFEYVSIIWVW